MSKVRQLSLRTNCSCNFIGSLVYSTSQLVILVLLTNLGSPEMIAMYIIGLPITATIIKLTKLQLRQIQASDAEEVDYKFNDYFGLSILSGIIMLCITLFIIMLNAYYLEKAIIIFLVGLTKVMDSYSDVVYGQLRSEEHTSE